MGTKRVTLADVARAAGVSQTAASFVLSGRREEMRISTEVEERVLQRRARDGLPAEHRLAEPPHRHEPHDRVRLRHRRNHSVRRPPDLGRARRRPRARTPAVHRRDRRGPRARARADRGDARPRASTGSSSPPCTRARSPSRRRSRTGRPCSSTPLPATRLEDPVGASRRGRGRPDRRPSAARRRAPGRDLPDRRRAPAQPGPKDSLAAVQRLQGIREALAAAGVDVAGAVALPRLAARPRLQRNATAAREDEAVRADLLQRPALPSAPTRLSPTRGSRFPPTCRSSRSTTTSSPHGSSLS